MTTKQAIIASLITIAVVIGLGILVMVLFIDLNAPGANERAGMLGSAFGTLAMFPFLIIWWKWGMTIRAQREAATRSKSRKRSRPDSGNA
jgi:hypothetical protein